MSVVNNACGWGPRLATVLMCGHCVGARGLETSSTRVTPGTKGYLLILTQPPSWPALGFHPAPGGYLTDMESDSSMTVWSVPGFRISGFECRRNPLRKSTGKPRVTPTIAFVDVSYHTVNSVCTDAAETTGDDNWEMLLNEYDDDDCRVSGTSNSTSNGPVHSLNGDDNMSV